MRQDRHSGTALVTADDVVAATLGGSGMSKRTALRRVVEAGGVRIGGRRYVSLRALRRTFGNDLADAVREAAMRRMSAGTTRN